jgi:hypothetical protein
MCVFLCAVEVEPLVSALPWMVRLIQRFANSQMADDNDVRLCIGFTG